MKIPVPALTHPMARAVRRQLSGTAVILLYHRVVELPADPYLLCVSPRHFDEQLQVIQKLGRPVSLAELDRGLDQGNILRRSMVITFDDGYADCLENAKPLLDHHDVPATVFVTSGYIGSDTEFWWDELERLLLRPDEVPETLQLRIRETECVWKMGETASYNTPSSHRYRQWTLADRDEPGSRQEAFRSVYEHLLALSDQERGTSMTAIRAWAGDQPRARSSHVILSAKDLTRLADGGLIEVGAHTVTHPRLPSLPPCEQRSEIEVSKAHLEEILERRVTSFAYPNGAYSDETVLAVRNAGFSRACSTIHDVVWRGSDRFKLPRFRVMDWDGDTFARRLAQWLDG